MSVFAKMLGEKVQSYIELRRSLGYAFKKQAGTLQAFVRHVESEQLGGPLTKGMALNFVLSFAGAANGRVHPSWSAPPLWRVSRRLRREHRSA
jgi:hypothetical protein